MPFSAWVYGGIRSVGKYVCVLDENKQLRVCHLVKGARRKLRKRLREEYSDTFIIVPFDYSPKKKL